MRHLRHVPVLSTSHRAATSSLCAVALALALVGCAAPPKPPSAAVPASAPEPEAVASAPVAAAASAVPAPPVAPALQQQAQKIALQAAEQLQFGKEDAARVELQRALAVDPNNKLAASFLKQMTVDPVATLGQESFSYTVKPNESLSKIAGRFLGDIYSFYILARYNNIVTPKLVAGGQVLRIPGKAPPPGTADRPVADKRPAKDAGKEAAAMATPRAAAGNAEVATVPASPAVLAAKPLPPVVLPPEPTPGEKAMDAAQAAERRGDLERALAEYRHADQLDQPGANERVARTTRSLATRYTTAARAASARQDLSAEIAAWDRVVELQPDNTGAQLERQKAQTLKKKFDAIKG